MKYHINKKGEPKQCRATKGACPLGLHFDNLHDASQFAFSKNSEKYNVIEVIDPPRSILTEDNYERLNENYDFQVEDNEISLKGYSRTDNYELPFEIANPNLQSRYEHGLQELMKREFAKEITEEIQKAYPEYESTSTFKDERTEVLVQKDNIAYIKENVHYFKDDNAVRTRFGVKGVYVIDDIDDLFAKEDFEIKYKATPTHSERIKTVRIASEDIYAIRTKDIDDETVYLFSKDPEQIEKIKKSL